LAYHFVGIRHDEEGRKPDHPVSGYPKIVLATHVRDPRRELEVLRAVDLDVHPIFREVRVQVASPAARVTALDLKLRLG